MIVINDGVFLGSSDADYAFYKIAMIGLLFVCERVDHLLLAMAYSHVHKDE
jgi:hypothetical protein